MIDLGETTFWEDFNIDWIKNASRNDQITPPNKVDVHASYGDYCYKRYVIVFFMAGHQGQLLGSRGMCWVSKLVSRVVKN